jgi:GT2 family glycosyltransferase
MRNSSNPELSIIIVSYNTRDLLVQCLSSVLEQTVGTDFEIIVVDNDSCDGSVNEVKSRFPRIKVLVNERNLGFSKANNLALKRARGMYALLLNPDTVVLDNALDKMVEFMRNHPGTGIIGCHILNDDGTLQRAAFPPPSLWTSITSKLNTERLSPGKTSRYYRRHLERLFPSHLTNSYYDKQYEKAKRAFRTGWVSGACLLIRRTTFEDIGLMDENLFLFGEDADWCTRARKRGWRVMLLPQATVVHLGGMSTSGALSISIEAGQFSRLYFAKKHFGLGAVFALRCMALAALLAKYIVIRFKPGIREAERRSRLRGYRRSFKIVLSRIK